MDIVSARKSVGCLSGEVLVNGAPRTADFARKTAYVPQVCCWQQASPPSVTVPPCIVVAGTVLAFDACDPKPTPHHTV
jgi:hypothetical protein